MNKKKKNIKGAITTTSLAAILATSSIAAPIAVPLVAAEESTESSLPIAIISSTSEDVIENEFIVSFKTGVSISDMKKSLAKFNIVEEHYNAGLATVKLTKSQFNNLKLNTNIDILEPNAEVEEERYGAIQQYTHEKTNIETAWSNNFKGKGVSIAVLDSGIANHNDLRIAGGASMVDYTTSYADDNGHGTHVAGIIGALDNNEGTTGVASEANIYAVKVLGKNNKGSLTDIIAGIDWAIQKGVDIINVSVGTSQNSVALKKRIDEATAKGIIVVASAGNTGDVSKYPALYDNVVAVGATDKNNQIASFSSRGSNIDVVAPGDGVPSTFLNNAYANGSGTSQAAPYVTGMLAVYKQAYPEKSPNELIELLYQNTLDLGSPGRDTLYGNGLVQFLKEETPVASVNPVLSADGSWLNWDAFAKNNRYLIQMEQKQDNGQYQSYRFGRPVGKEEFDLYLLEEGYQYRMNITPHNGRGYDEAATKQVYVALINGAKVVSETEITAEQIPQTMIVEEPTSAIQLDTAKNRIYWEEMANSSYYRVQTEQQQADGSFVSFNYDRPTSKTELSLSFLKKGHIYRVSVVPRNDRRQFDESQAIKAYIHFDSNGQKTLSYTNDFNNTVTKEEPTPIQDDVPTVTEEPTNVTPVIEQTPVTEEPTNDAPVIEQTPVTEEPTNDTPVIEQTPVTEEPLNIAPIMSKYSAERIPPVQLPSAEEVPLFTDKLPNDAPIMGETPVDELLAGFSVSESKQVKWPEISNAKRYRVEMKQKNSAGNYVQYSYNRNVTVTQFDLRSLPKGEYQLTIVPYIGFAFDYEQAYKVQVNTSTFELSTFE